MDDFAKEHPTIYGFSYMSALLAPHILLTGLLIFTARICDVATGSIRTIITVQGRTAFAFALATVEISIWIKVFSSAHGLEIAEAVRALGQAVTIFHGEGLKGPVCELNIACRRREVKRLLTEINRVEADAF